MRKLKCNDCGGILAVSVNDDGMALGTCAYCSVEYLLDRQRNQYVILEHRYAGQPTSAAPNLSNPVTRRVVLGLAGGTAVLALVASPLISLLSHKSDGEGDAGARVVFNVGSKGSGPGQFRGYPSSIGIDTRGRSVIMDPEDRIYVFDADGGFIANYPKIADTSWHLASLPQGDLILYNSGPRQLVRFDVTTGTVIAREDIQPVDGYEIPNISGSATADGGFAVYEEKSIDRDEAPSLPVPDAITFYGPDLKNKRRLTGLIATAVSADPMVRSRPRVSSFAVDGAGSIFINLQANEDEDSRGGIYEFNADGTFQRRIVVTQGISGKLILSPDGSLWFGDAWVRELQRINGEEVQKFDLSEIAFQSSQSIGNVGAIAAYPNGDIGIVTYGHQLVRIAPKTE